MSEQIVHIHLRWLFSLLAKFYQNLVDHGKKLIKVVHVDHFILMSNGDLFQLVVVHRETNTNCNNLYTLVLLAIEYINKQVSEKISK